MQLLICSFGGFISYSFDAYISSLDDFGFIFHSKSFKFVLFQLFALQLQTLKFVNPDPS